MQVAFVAQNRHAKSLILIVLIDIESKVTRLRNAPGNFLLLSITGLRFECGIAAIREKCASIVFDEQGRHEIFEHGAAPREQYLLAVGLRHGPPEMLPVTVRHIAFGNRDQAGNPRFGRQQIVVTRVEPFGAGVVSNMKHLSALIEQEAKIHASHGGVRLPCQFLKTNQQGRDRHARRR